MDIGGWDTISILAIAKVNTQLADRLSKLLMIFDTTVIDGFAGNYDVKGTFGAWSITGGSQTDVYVDLPLTTGTLTPKGAATPSTDISGMVIQVEINLAWIPSTVTPGARELAFDLSDVTSPGGTRDKGGIYVRTVTDPKDTGFGGEVGNAIANALVDNKDKITFIFAQTGIVDTSTATWLLPKQSIYSYEVRDGTSDAYLAILSVVTDRDISQLNANIDARVIDPAYPLTFVVSGELFLENIIMPALPGAFPGTAASNFSYRDSAISLAQDFDLPAIREGAIDYTPHVTSLSIGVNGNALKSSTSGTCDLHLPKAYLEFSATSNNLLVFDAVSHTFTLRKDPNPTTKSDSHVPWYDYLIGLGPIGAGVMAIVLAAVESGLGDSLSGSRLAGNLSALPQSSVKWPGLDNVTVNDGALDDCFVLHADVS